jgi:hypothetical protein
MFVRISRTKGRAILNWHKELAGVTSEKGVMVLVNDYVQSVKPEIGARLPGNVLDEVHDGRDLQALQHRVVQTFMGNPIYAVDVAVQDLCVFVIRASSRAHELASRKMPVVKRHDNIFASSYEGDSD